MPQKNPPMNGRSMLKHIVTKYDNTSHNTIQIEPNKTKSPSNFLWVAWHLQNTAKNDRKYTEIKNTISC